MSFRGPNHPMWDSKNPFGWAPRLDVKDQQFLNEAFASLALETSAPPSSPAVHTISHSVLCHKRRRETLQPEMKSTLVAQSSPREIVQAVRKARTTNKPARCASDPGAGASANRVSVEIRGLLLYNPPDVIEGPPRKHMRRCSSS